MPLNRGQLNVRKNDSFDPVPNTETSPTKFLQALQLDPRFDWFNPQHDMPTLSLDLMPVSIFYFMTRYGIITYKCKKWDRHKKTGRHSIGIGD